MTTHTARRALILDDGEYFVELNEAFPVGDAPGFLQRRCYIGVTTPDGYESVGRFDRDPHGGWHAGIDAPYDSGTNSSCRSLGRHSGRMDAIVALWFARREALCRHRGE
jgi:hypothetical protein